MLRTSRRFVVLAAVGIIAIPLTVVATAYACANLMSAKLDRASATPSTQVQFMGRNFNSNSKASPVSIRWNGRRGAVLFEGRPSRNGKLSTKVTVPDNVRPGYYMVLATQIGPNGKPAAGSPARAVLKVVRSKGSSNSSVVAAPVTPGGPAGPSAPLAIGLGLSGLLLVGSLTAMAVRRRRVPTGLSSTA